MSDLTSYGIIALVAAGVTVLTVPAFWVLSSSRNVMAHTSDRSTHTAPVGSLGGGAMFLGFVVAMGVAWGSGWFPETFSGTTEPIGVLLCGALAYGVGVVDDIRDISAPAKMAGIVLAGSLLVMSGVSVFWFRIPFVDPIFLSLDWGFLLTVLWVVGMANAVNFIDGLDGLAAGIVAIGAGAFFLYSNRLTEVGLVQEGNVGPLVAAVIVGMCVGFLPYNIHPARIFMGDGGSLLLGSLMAACTISVGGRTEDPFSGQTFFFYAPLVIPFVILAVPILDTALAIARRAGRGQGLATADKDHLHHRLMRIGHGHLRSVIILWAWTALLSGFVLWPVYNDGRGDAIVPAGVLTLALLLFTLFAPGIMRTSKAARAQARALAPKVGK